MRGACLDNSQVGYTWLSLTEVHFAANVLYLYHARGGVCRSKNVGYNSYSCY